MDERQRTILRDLLTGQRVLALAVLADGEPVIGLLPFAVGGRFGALVVGASQLARHSRGLTAGASFDALVHVPAGPDVDPFQVPRLTLRGRVATLAGGSREREEAEARYLGRFPSATGLLDLGDFDLYRLDVDRGRLVTGFAGAVNVGLADLHALAPAT